MGLLDSLNLGGGGLLDFLLQQQQNSFSGLPSDQAQYGAAPAAPMQANAQMMPQQRPPMQASGPQQQPAPQMQPAPQPSGGNFLGNLSSGFQSLGNGGSILGVLSGHPTDETSQLRQAQNQTAQYLVSKQGMDPALAQSIVSDPATLRAILPSIMGVGGQTDDIKEYQFAKKEDPSLTFAKFMEKKRSTTGEYSLTPQYGTDKDGNTVLLQTGKSGTAIQTVLPPGVKVSSGVEKIDLGTSWGLVDKRTGQLVGQQAKDIEGKESAEERGKARGLAQANLPSALAKAQQSLQLIDEMIKHPGREAATGASGTFDPRNYMAGSDATDFQVRSKQLEGKAFLEAYEQLKGTGSISEVEGAKATAAIGRLDKRQSDKEYVTALNDLRTILVDGMERARVKAGQPASAPAAASPTPEISRADAEAELRRRGKIK